MAHYKRGYPRRSVRCCMCTDNRDGNCGKHRVDLEDGYVDGKHKAKARPRPFIVEYKRTGPRPTWWSRKETWPLWLVLGRYSTEAGALNALRDAKEKDRGPYGAIRCYGSEPEYRVRYKAQEAKVSDGDQGTCATRG